MVNQFPSGTDLTRIEVTINGTTTDAAGKRPLEPGETVTRTFAFASCGDLGIEASGDGVAVSLERSVTCE